MDSRVLYMVGAEGGDNLRIELYRKIFDEGYFLSVCVIYLDLYLCGWMKLSLIIHDDDTLSFRLNSV